MLTTNLSRTLIITALLASLAVPSKAVTLKVVTHYHTLPYSQTGALPLAEVVDLLRERKVDVLLATETFLATYEYGLWPLRGLARKRVTNASVLSRGLRRYLSELRELGRSRPDILLIPGVEAAAFYRWKGDPRHGLVLEDWHRHLLVYGLRSPGDWRGLPVLGNPWGGEFQPHRLWPLLILCAVAALWRGGRRKSSAAAVLAAAALLACGWPYRGIPEDSYRADTPWRPYQRLIDYVRARGGLAVWAHPDAPNWEKATPVAPRVSIRTAPYPEAVLRTVGHAGFGYFSEGWRRTGAPGGEWDRALGLYLRGERERPVWAFGELDWRRPSDSDVDRVAMMVEASSRTAEAVLEALDRGRFYNSSGRKRVSLVLRDWRLDCGAPPRVAFELAHDDGGPRTAEATLVRDGKVVLREKRPLPYRWSFADARNRETRTFYRLIASDGEGRELVSNPLFCPEGP